MEGATERPKATAFETVTTVTGLLGMAAIAAAFVDGQYMDILPGENPFSSQEEGGLGAFRKMVKGLRDIPDPDSGIEFEDFTTQQKISATGLSLTFWSLLITGRPFKSMQVFGAGTIGTLAAYEAMLLPLSAVSGLTFYGGASTIMYTTALMALAKKPKSISEQINEGVDKVNKIRGKIAGKKNN